MQVMAERVIGFRDPDVDQFQRWVLGASRLKSGRVRLGEMVEIGSDVSGMLAWVKRQLDRALASPATLSLDDNAAPRWVDNLWIRRHESLPIRVEAA